MGRINSHLYRLDPDFLMKSARKVSYRRQKEGHEVPTDRTYNETESMRPNKNLVKVGQIISYFGRMDGPDS